MQYFIPVSLLWVGLAALSQAVLQLRHSAACPPRYSPSSYTQDRTLSSLIYSSTTVLALISATHLGLTTVTQ